MKQLIEYFKPEITVDQYVDELASSGKKETTKVVSLVQRFFLNAVAELLDLDPLMKPSQIAQRYINHRQYHSAPVRIAMDCVHDIPATAALFLEIIRSEFNVKDRFHAIDFGCGTGILSIALLIAGLRKKVTNLQITAIEKNKTLAGVAERLLAKIPIKKDQTIEVCNYDFLTQAERMQLLLSEEVHGVVSETLMMQTPTIRFEGERLMVGNGRETSIDCLPSLMQLLVRNIPDLANKLRKRDMFMVPDMHRYGITSSNGSAAICLPHVEGEHFPLPLLLVGRSIANRFEVIGSGGRWSCMP